MVSTKDQAIIIIKQQPEDSTFKDLIHELVMARIVERGLKDVAAGNVIDDEKVDDIILQWQK